MLIGFGRVPVVQGLGIPIGIGMNMEEAHSEPEESGSRLPHFSELVVPWGLDRAPGLDRVPGFRLSVRIGCLEFFLYLVVF